MPETYRGQFLIAGKRLRDPNFYKTVVLMVEHGDEGAMGLVVNRPSSVSVAHALSEHFKLPQTDDLVYVGGPVEPQALFIVHNAAEFDTTEHPVLPGLYVGSSAEVFEEVVRTAAEQNGGLDFRIYSGCAGWAPDQLEGEIARGDWYILPGDTRMVFHEDPYAVWEETLRRYQQANCLLPDPHSHPEWN